MHPAKVAGLLESLPPAQRTMAWEMVDTERAGKVLVHLHEDAAGVVWIAPSPQPLAPSGVKGEGVTTATFSVIGTSLMVGIR